MQVEIIGVEGLFTDGTSVYNVYATHAGEEYQQVIFAETEHDAVEKMAEYVNDVLDSQTNREKETH